MNYHVFAVLALAACSFLLGYIVGKSDNFTPRY